MESPPRDDLDDGINLESKVLLALSRLQKGKMISKKLRKTTEVSCKKVVEFLTANYSWLDGDVESQVMTALLSCVKTGIVCALDNGKYRLVGPNSKTMTSNCLSRTSHGPKCCCLSMLKYMFKTNPRVCCHLKNTEASVNRARRAAKGKPTVKQKSTPSPRRCVKKKPPPRKQRQIKCPPAAQKLIGEGNKTVAMIGENTSSKCNYCLEIHTLPKSRRLCTTCFPLGAIRGAAYDQFSPRDELMSTFDSST